MTSRPTVAGFDEEGVELVPTSPNRQREAENFWGKDDSSDDAKPTGIWKDKWGVLLLLVLYTLQGIPMGLGGSIPLLLQERNVGYSQQAIFNLVSWPFSLKLLWAPLVDAVYSQRFGRRKSWLVPIQLATGIIMIGISCCVTSLLGDDGSAPDVSTLTIAFFTLFFMMATQDIAVDGWALTILSRENVGFASTCNSVGQTAGYFMSYVGFLVLNDPATCNKYFRSAPLDYPMVTLAGFLFFWGWIFVIVTVLLIFKSEKKDEDEELGVAETYKQLWQVLQLPAVQSLCLVMVTCKMGFAAADNVTSLKIVEYGLPKESLAGMTLFLIPMGILIPIVVAKYTSGPDPLGIFMLGVWPRVAVGLIYMGIVHTVGAAIQQNNGAVPSWLFFVIIGGAILHEVAANLMFVAQMAFFNRVSDERIGGTYMTLLNTVANLGSKWPASLVMFLVDPFTTKACSNQHLPSNTCGTTALQESCKAQGGTCTTVIDGYYILSIVCTVVAVAWYFLMQKRVKDLRAMSPKEWQVRE